jgi:2-alkenal reductase
MQKSSGHIVNRETVAVLILLFVVLAGSFAILYLNLESEIAALKNENADLSSELAMLQEPAVAVYNHTKFSFVTITTDKGEGSGFVYDSQGHIVTNNHVIQGAGNITVTFFDGSVETAQVIGTPDIYSDLALIKVNALPAHSEPASIRNSTRLAVGEPVYALGNPFGLRSSLTSGIISQLERVKTLADLGEPVSFPEANYSMVDLIQFDAAVNVGNSGGPLLDSAGNVIGITFALETDRIGINAFIGIAYAVPSIFILRIIPALESAGHYDHPWVGIEYDANHTGGARVSDLVPGGPAANAGLQEGDVIKQIDGVSANSGADFVIYLERYSSPADTVHLQIDRSGSIISKTLTLASREPMQPGP